MPLSRRFSPVFLSDHPRFLKIPIPFSVFLFLNKIFTIFLSNSQISEFVLQKNRKMSFPVVSGSILSGAALEFYVFAFTVFLFKKRSVA